MKSLLAKIAVRKFIGLSLGEREVAVSEVAMTPLGPVEVASRTEPCQSSSEMPAAIERILQPPPGQRKRRLLVGVGLANSRIFFGTRPLRGGADPSPEAVLQKLLCSSDVSIEDLTYDLIKSSVDKAPVASVAACRKKYMAAVLAALQRCGAQVVRSEPAACALVRAAMHRHRPPHRAKTLLQIFLGTADGLAVWTVEGLPLAWRPFPLPSFSEGMAILSAARTLLSQSQYHGMETSLDYAIVYGRPDLHERLQKEGLPTDIGARMIWHENPELGGKTIALGLALGCLNPSVPAFDLSRWIKPQALLRDIFPWGELAAEVVIMLCMGLVLAHQSDHVSRAYAAVKFGCDGNRILASSDAAQLEKEKKDLTQKLDSLHQFLDSRLPWTAYTRILAENLPSGTYIGGLQGESPMEAGGKRGGGKPKRTLRFMATASLTPSGAIPPEVGKFLASLRKHPLMRRNFPQIELTGIHQSQSKNDKGVGTAGFTIVCQPETGRGK